jgi:Flp pilus assembly pilin Flp
MIMTGPAQMNKILQRFLKDDSGVSTIECGLIFAGILIAVAAVVMNLGDPLNATFVSESSAQ